MAHRSFIVILITFFVLLIASPQSSLAVSYSITLNTFLNDLGANVTCTPPDLQTTRTFRVDSSVNCHDVGAGISYYAKSSVNSLEIIEKFYSDSKCTDLVKTITLKQNVCTYVDKDHNKALMASWTKVNSATSLSASFALIALAIETFTVMSIFLL